MTAVQTGEKILFRLKNLINNLKIIFLFYFLDVGIISFTNNSIIELRDSVFERNCFSEALIFFYETKENLLENNIFLDNNRFKCFAPLYMLGKILKILSCQIVNMLSNVFNGTFGDSGVAVLDIQNIKSGSESRFIKVLNISIKTLGKNSSFLVFNQILHILL